MSQRMKQNSITDTIRPEVSLVSMTANPIGTIFSLWYGSRHSKRVDPKIIQDLYEGIEKEEYQDTINLICESYPEHAGQGRDYKNVISKIVYQVIEADLPPTESVLFTFCIDNANVAWREQLVRSKFASYWMQTSRTQDLTTMDINMNDSVRLLGGEKAVEIYKEAGQYIRDVYKKLVELGVPVEDIRLQPQGCTHRVYWMINLRSLIKIINKRSDWIAQATLWTPINAGVCKILRSVGIMDIVQNFIGKPFAEVSMDNDFNDWRVISHQQTTENEDRFYGRDPLPCDPLWLAYSGNKMPKHTNIDFYDYMKSLFIQIWQDPYLKVLGWDRNDPTVLGPYDRPQED